MRGYEPESSPGAIRSSSGWERLLSELLFLLFTLTGFIFPASSSVLSSLSLSLFDSVLEIVQVMFVEIMMIFMHQ